MNEQYGNSGYNRVGDYTNPYDQREGDRYNNYAQGPYDAQAGLLSTLLTSHQPSHT